MNQEQQIKLQKDYDLAIFELKSLRRKLEAEQRYTKEVEKINIDLQNRIISVDRNGVERDTVGIQIDCKRFYHFSGKDREQYIKHAVIDSFHMLMDKCNRSSFLRELRAKILA